ncbi:MAG: ferritin [Rhodothermales bacterium]|nr:ferritin [Rhodothermales bacterium]
MKQEVQKAINDQIRAEFQSAYAYLAMSARMDEMRLPGMAAWLKLQWEEEIAHAMKFYEFMLQRDARVDLLQLNAPDADFSTALECFELVLSHEQKITAKINKLYQLAVAEGDYPLQTLLQWFIDEQVEEEENARNAIDALTLVGDSGPGLFMLDRELGARKPEAEAAE